MILFFVVGAVGIPNLAQAQEGEVIEEKSENSEIIPRDSLPIISESPEDGGRDNYGPLPVGPMPDFKLSKVPLNEPNYEKEEKKCGEKNTHHQHY